MAQFTKEERRKIKDALNAKSGWEEYISCEKGLLDMDTGCPAPDDLLEAILTTHGLDLHEVLGITKR